MAYTPPDSHDIIFDFTDSGYVPPSSLDVTLTSFRATISGTVSIEGVLSVRPVALYNRINGVLEGEQLSNNPTVGHFSFTVLDPREYYIVVLDTSDTYGALIFDHITGVE